MMEWSVLAVVVIAVVTLSIRVSYVLDRDKWVVIHPDEIFQSLEVAHIERHGFGFRSYEFSSPFGDVTNKNMTAYRKMEIDAGLSALRSPIYPYYYVITSRLASAFGAEVNPYVMFRVSHVLVTSALPIAVYVYCTQMFGSRDMGVLAAILTSSSVYLNVIGSHSLFHSFLSPFLFLTMATFAALTRVKSQQARQPVSDSNKLGPKLENFSSFPDMNNNIGGKICINNNSFSKKVCIGSDMNLTVKTTKKDFVSDSKFTQQYNQKETYTFVYRISLSNTMNLFCFGIPLYLGVCAVILTCYIRPDSILLYGITISMLVTSKSHKLKTILSFWGVIVSVSAIVTVTTICVLIDTQYFGGLTITPLNWIFVNVIQNKSTSLFGSMPFWFYFKVMGSHDPITSTLCVTSIAIYLSVGIYFVVVNFIHQDPKLKNTDSKIKSSFFMSSKLLLASFGQILIYSFHGHKEIRFIHDGIVLLLVFIASTASLVLSFVKDVHKLRRMRMILFIALIVTSHLQWSRFYGHPSTTQWTFHQTPDTQSTNACLDFVSQQSDVHGVFIQDNIFLTGGMPLLHKNVPIITGVMKGFFEFDASSELCRSEYETESPYERNNLSSSSASSSYLVNAHCVQTFSRAADYFSPTNSAGVLRAVLERESYNYLVVTSPNPFAKIGFSQVFQHGNRNVMKRNSEAAVKLRLKNILPRLPICTNETDLLHEGDVLYQMKRYKKAALRFQHSLQISDSAEGYLPLYDCLRHTGRSEEAARVMKQCVHLHGKGPCWTPRKMTRLH